MTNIFIVENSSAIRATLQSVLSDMSRIKVVGQAMNESGAIERIGALLPDIVILNLGLQSGSGIGVLEHVKKYHEKIKVIVLTHFPDPMSIERCRNAGADYLFEKTTQLMQLREALLEGALLE